MKQLKNHPYIGQPVTYPGKNNKPLKGVVLAVRKYEGFFAEISETKIKVESAVDHIEIKIQPEGGGKPKWFGPMEDNSAKKAEVN